MAVGLDYMSSLSDLLIVESDSSRQEGSLLRRVQVCH